jgi:hypothetical protein
MARAEHFTLSGAECVIALITLGFAVLRRAPGRTILRRREQLVFVPDFLELPNSVLNQILTQTGLDHASLLAAIDDLPTMSDLEVLEPAE